jgi:hypothetical protein
VSFFVVEKNAKLYNVVIYNLVIFTADFASQEFFNKNPTAWLGGARPAYTLIPPSALGFAPSQPAMYPPPKIHLQVLKNLQRKSPNFI